jgi:uncharacterized protein HemX
LTNADIASYAALGPLYIGAGVGWYKARQRAREAAEEIADLEAHKESKARAEEKYDILDRYRQEMARMQGMWEACEARSTLLQEQLNEVYKAQGRIEERMK